MDFILMGEFALCRINISKAGQDLGRRWHNDLAALLVGLALPELLAAGFQPRIWVALALLLCSHWPWHRLLSSASVCPWCLRSGQAEVAPSWV